MLWYGPTTRDEIMLQVGEKPHTFTPSLSLGVLNDVMAVSCQDSHAEGGTEPSMALPRAISGDHDQA